MNPRITELYDELLTLVYEPGEAQEPLQRCVMALNLHVSVALAQLQQDQRVLTRIARHCIMAIPLHDARTGAWKEIDGATGIEKAIKVDHLHLEQW